MGKINFDFNLLKNAVVEKDVENAYRTLFSKLFTKYGLTSPFGCDGYLTDENGLDVLCEFKYTQDLKSKVEQVKILAQTLYYLKKFYTTGTQLPKCIFVGDTNECFAIHVNPLTKYLDYSLDWSIAPSSAHKNNPQLIQDMLSDEQINPFVFELREDFVWEAISRKLIDLSTNVKRLVKVTDSNIVEVFEYFCDNVLDKKCTLNAHDKASLFISRLIDDKDIYLHPKKNGCLITKDFGEVKVNEQNYINFFEHFDGSQYSIREKENLVKIVDRIIDDSQRRRSGDFFTPAIWVDEAHKMISEQFGDDWKEKYVVWDPAWGTGNLTRDYKFKELYCSTLHQSEIDVANSNRVNPEAVKFQYDFLNDGIIDGKIDILGDSKLPQGLKDAILGGKEIIVLMNPPYGTSSNLNFDSDDTKSDIAKTSLNTLMLNDKMGKSSSQLYSQFLYRLCKLNNNGVKICLFSPPLFISGSSYKEFRKLFFNKFGYINGFLMNAGEFDGTSDWGLTFTIWDKPNQNIENFKFEVKQTNDNFEIIYLCDKIIYNLDNYLTARDWVYKKSKINRYENDVLTLTSALSIKSIDKFPSNFIGSFLNSGNNVYYNHREVILGSSRLMCGNNRSNPIVDFNLFDSLCLFTMRKVITGKYANWINQKDEYLAPTPEVEQSDKFKQFQYDSLVYSLFNTSSNQSSMRQIDYKGKKWDIKNEFFWMSKEEMMNLADQEGFDDLYYDAKNSDDRYVYNLLFKEGIYDKLSPDAKEVLDMASHLVRKTFKMRKTLNDLKPEYHLNTFDAGFYQIKLILKEYFQIDNVRFSAKYKEFEDRMRPLVYELGFLK